MDRQRNVLAEFSNQFRAKLQCFGDWHRRFKHEDSTSYPAITKKRAASALCWACFDFSAGYRTVSARYCAATLPGVTCRSKHPVQSTAQNSRLHDGTPGRQDRHPHRGRIATLPGQESGADSAPHRTAKPTRIGRASAGRSGRDRTPIKGKESAGKRQPFGG